MITEKIVYRIEYMQPSVTDEWYSWSDFIQRDEDKALKMLEDLRDNKFPHIPRNRRWRLLKVHCTEAIQVYA